MNLYMSLYLAVLFVALTPGVLLTLPKGGKKMTVAVVHGLVFAVVWYFTHRMAFRYSMQLSGFQDMNMEEEEEMNAEGFQNTRIVDAMVTRYKDRVKNYREAVRLGKDPRLPPQEKLARETAAKAALATAREAAAQTAAAIARLPSNLRNQYKGWNTGFNSLPA